MSLRVEIQESARHRRIRLAVWVVASAAALFAVGQTAFCLVLTRRPASADNLARAERWLLRSGLRADWEWLVKAGYSAGNTVTEWLDTVDLAALQRRQFYEALPESTFREHIQSPHLEPGQMMTGALRRELWRHFAPRVRKEADLTAAAASIARELRTRVNPQAGVKGGTLSSSWERGEAHPIIWEALYVAALRSAGIAARMGEAHKAEIWLDSAWLAAPRPLFGS